MSLNDLSLCAVSKFSITLYSLLEAQLLLNFGSKCTVIEYRFMMYSYYILIHNVHLLNTDSQCTVIEY